MTKIPSFVNLCHFFTFYHPKNQLEKYTPPYGTARGDPILMEGTVLKYIVSVVSSSSHFTNHVRGSIKNLNQFIA
jgi:hypothetical protein